MMRVDTSFSQCIVQGSHPISSRLVLLFCFMLSAARQSRCVA